MVAFFMGKVFEKFKDRIWLSSPTLHGDEQKYVQLAFDTNWVSTVGENINKFEETVCDYIGSKYAIGLS
jgi:dTDP-4-amino-4,6-dideoxygalactose transaminase